LLISYLKPGNRGEPFGDTGWDYDKGRPGARISQTETTVKMPKKHPRRILILLLMENPQSGNSQRVLPGLSLPTKRTPWEIFMNTWPIVRKWR